MGCLWSAALYRHLHHKATNPVTLLLRDAQALARYPGAITIEHSTTAGTQLTNIAAPALALTDAASAQLSIKRLLLCCKAQDTDAAMASVAHSLDPQALVVLMQNGIHVQQQLSQRRPFGTVFCLSTSSGAWLRKPFHAVAAGTGESWLGNLYADQNPGVSSAQTGLLAELPQTEMNIRIEQHMPQRLWEKLAVNCAINGLTVIYDCHNGELLTLATARAHCEALCAEITQLMHSLPRTPAITDLWPRVQQVLRVTRHNVSSTLQDVRNQRETEIDHLNGFLCRLAEQHGLPCPLNQQVLAAVLESARPSKITSTSPA